MPKQRKFENKTNYIPPEVSLNYLEEVNEMKSIISTYIRYS